MERKDVVAAVDATLAVIEAVAARTRSPADDLLTAILRSQKDRVAEAVLALLEPPGQLVTPERVAEALAAVGIKAGSGR